MLRTTLLLSLLAGLFLALPACKKSSGGGSTTNTSDTTLPTAVLNIVPQPLIDSFKTWGLKINPGQNPPALSGIYLLSPDSCIFDNSIDHITGWVIDPAEIGFSAMNAQESTIQVKLEDSLDPGSRDSTVSAAYITGSGNAFTVFSILQGVEEGITVTSIDIFSGQIGQGGITNLQIGYHLNQKSSDPSGNITDVGASRVFVSEAPVTATIPAFTTTAYPRQLLPGKSRTLFSSHR